MNSILVATNFSPLSMNATLYAAALAKQFKAKLILFNAFRLPLHASNTLLSAASINDIIEESKNKLEESALQIKKDFGIEVYHECIYASIEDVLEQMMSKYDAKILIIGMSIKSIEQNLLGNPTTTLISLKKIPVLAIPLKAKYTGIKRILFACDIMENVPLKILARLRQFALLLKSEVEVFFVEQKINELKAAAISKENNLNQLNTGLYGITTIYKDIKSDFVIDEIKKEIEVFNAELLVMIPKKGGFWESIIHKSKTRMMASGMDIPLFSIPV
ncbi:universal stress protein [Yeosuana marina]|uniref:universal stress protein n=1 Tax=Yeosuana marina TaxID=1565536 RepID=UPI0030C7CEEF